MSEVHPHSIQPPTGGVSLTEVASMSRDQLVDRLLHFHGSIHLDFCSSFLDSKSTEQLRHILIAASKAHS
jgi:hypothetical protein